MSELIPTVFAMAKTEELLVDLRLAQPGAPGVSTMPGTTTPSFSMVLPVKTKLSPSPFASSTNSGRLFNGLVRIDIVAKFVAGTQLSQVLMESLFTDFQLRGKQVLAMITDGAAINRAAVRNLHPRNAFMPQMIRWTSGVVYRQKSPLLAVHNTPALAGHNLSFSHTHNQGHLCRPGMFV